MISRFLSVIFSIIVMVVLALVIINHSKFSSLVSEAVFEAE
ncbi:MAG: hypothetical protein SNH01_04925 [Rikenellaceae bacterium]